MPHSADETLAAYADGSLHVPVRRPVEAHLASCDDCLELLGEVTAALEALPASPIAAPVRFPEINAGERSGPQ